MPATPDIKTYNGEAHAANLVEADMVRDALERRTGKKYFVSAGPRNWRDGKPLCYTIAPLFKESE